jgi:hypothetical protein
VLPKAQVPPIPEPQKAQVPPTPEHQKELVLPILVLALVLQEHLNYKELAHQEPTPEQELHKKVHLNCMEPDQLEPMEPLLTDHQA